MTASLVEVDVDVAASPVLDVVVSVVLEVVVVLVVLLGVSSLLALPNGTEPGAAAWQPATWKVTTRPARRDTAH
ncbi:hypothetical protein [Nannocystis punicea]|uniref:Uncharacterized protein n=1 Tax=Nannocystis punicea TaxID=2995304 RepID=A0ABY7H072_9BACT|nr:hypothetical protein [Nannocystis poenicansa]WAS92479.1 hypothetical protein O0S08_40385 [Nannocystis poenicansa]